MLQWVSGLLVLKFREKLHSIPVQPDYSVLCSQLALETNFARFFTASTCAHGDDLAEFYIEDFPYVMNNSHTRKEEMEVKVETFRLFIQIDRRGNFKGHRLWKACIGERELTAEEAYLFMSTYLFGTAHVQIHALANWGVITHKFENPFLRRMSVITVMYNYYGFTFFTRIISNFSSNLSLTFTERSISSQNLEARVLQRLLVMYSYSAWDSKVVFYPIHTCIKSHLTQGLSLS